jgi:hypothetical protein
MKNGEPFHTIPVQPEQPTAFHSYFAGNNLDICARYAIRLVIDRVREAGNNPRLGTVTMYFEDNGVGAKWEPRP